MREETRTGVDAEGNPRQVVILIPETPEDVEELQRRAAAGLIRQTAARQALAPSPIRLSVPEDRQNRDAWRRFNFRLSRR